MRLVATEYISLDGMFHEPGLWSNPWFDDDAGRFKDAELQASDALLLGRRTYEGFAAAWPHMEEETGAFGVKMNTMPKYVVSSTLTDLEWSGSELVEGDLADAIRELKARPGGDLLLSGSAQLFNALMREDLIDLYRLMLFPVVLGGGERLFREGNEQQALTLVGTQSFGAGVVILEYTP